MVLVTVNVVVSAPSRTTVVDVAVLNAPCRALGISQDVVGTDTVDSPTASLVNWISQVASPTLLVGFAKVNVILTASKTGTSKLVTTRVEVELPSANRVEDNSCEKEPLNSVGMSQEVVGTDTVVAPATSVVNWIAQEASPVLPVGSVTMALVLTAAKCTTLKLVNVTAVSLSSAERTVLETWAPKEPATSDGRAQEVVATTAVDNAAASWIAQDASIDLPVGSTTVVTVGTAEKVGVLVLVTVRTAPETTVVDVVNANVPLKSTGM